MNELQVFFGGSDIYNNWIYFKTNECGLFKAIKAFCGVMNHLKGQGLDFCDMKPTAYVLWNKEQNCIDEVVVDDLKQLM